MSLICDNGCVVTILIMHGAYTHVTSNFKQDTTNVAF